MDQASTKKSSHKGNDVLEIPVGKIGKYVRHNLWMLLSMVLVVVLLVVLFQNGSSVSGSVSAQEAGAQLISFINAQGNGQATLVSSEQQGSLYQVTVKYNGQDIPVFVTLDGKYLVAQPVPLNGSIASDPGAPAQGEKVSVEVGDAPVIGEVTAPVTIIEFSDFSCPFCAAASGDNPGLTATMKQRSPSWEPIVTNVMKDYVATGKVRFAVKYSFGHSGGHPAQLVAWCLNDQKSELYWKFYPKAFAAQEDVEDLTKMKDIAKSVGADMTKLQTCLDSKKYDARFDKEQNEGTAAGVQGTPAFIVNGQLVSGAVPYSQVKNIIESELAQAG